MYSYIVLVVVLLCLVVSGCKFTRVETASRAQTEMIGLSKDQILACMGAAATLLWATSALAWDNLARTANGEIALPK